MRVFSLRLQGHEINYINYAYFQVGNILPQKVYCRERLERGNITRTRHNDIRLTAPVRASPVPNRDSGGAVLDGSIHFEPLRRWLFARNDHIDVVVMLEAMVGH